MGWLYQKARLQICSSGFKPNSQSQWLGLSSDCGVPYQAIDFEKVNDHVAVVAFEHGFVDAGDALPGFALGRDDNHASRLAHPQAQYFESISRPGTAARRDGVPTAADRPSVC